MSIKNAHADAVSKKMKAAGIKISRYCLEQGWARPDFYHVIRNGELKPWATKRLAIRAHLQAAGFWPTEGEK